MNTICIWKAQPAVKAQPIPSVTIVIDKEMPTIDNNLDLHDLVLTEDAHRLERELYNTLPGGTYDRLLATMLLRKATHFRVPHGDVTREAEK